MSLWIKLKQILHTVDNEPLETYPDVNSPGKNFLGVKNPHLEDLIGSVDEETVTNHAADEARVLGLLRGILSKAGAGASEETLAAVLDKLNAGLGVSLNGSLPALSAGSNLIGKVEIAKVTPTIITVRNQSIAAGAFIALGTFLASDGIKTISGSFRSPDNVFSNAFYIAHVGADGISLSTVYGAASSKKDSSFTGNMCSAKAIVYFNNADTVAHVINADIVGFPN